MRLTLGRYAILRSLQTKDGGDKGSRTPDLLNAIETLYQLSYIPVENAA